MTDLRLHLIRQIVFSKTTFGPGERTHGVIDHIRKELAEIEAAPDAKDRAKEWVDVVILGLDGLWRATQAAQEARIASAEIPDEDWGFKPSVDDWAMGAVAAIIRKQRINEQRQWPDWRTASEDKAIEHDRSKD